MNILGFLKNIANEVSKKNIAIEEMINNIFKAKLECGCFGYDCCVGYLQLPSHNKTLKKGFYMTDNGDLYFGTLAQAKAVRAGEPNTGTKIN